MMGFATMATWTIIVLFFVDSLVTVVGQEDEDFVPSPNHIDEQLDQTQDFRNNDNDNGVKQMSDLLARLLLLPWPHNASPLLYVEEPHESLDQLREEIFDSAEPDDLDSEQELRPISPKRSKYYRKYPWKRQNNRYEPAYMCIPKKDDVFRLLVALHSERNGKRGQLVDFCNRKRPASLVFTNIRFVG